MSYLLEQPKSSRRLRFRTQTQRAMKRRKNSWKVLVELPQAVFRGEDGRTVTIWKKRCTLSCKGGSLEMERIGNESSCHNQRPTHPRPQMRDRRRTAPVASSMVGNNNNASARTHSFTAVVASIWEFETREFRACVPSFVDNNLEQTTKMGLH